ncbi:MAG: hypothetical protein CMG47_02570 [Candidatus Marinimicrobia bacterium]|jgi:hypothetical protein|nr:hypothetical protein [Candidatus Neomarinimicrobiota bacterium]|tara:strand:+ start:1671 stop:1943 length:273 start_codon:yes stop_codon:yes gene_type:complete
MKIEAVKLNDMVTDKADIYTTIMVISNRARQIIDKRFLEQINLEDVEDSEELIQFSKEDFDKEKPMMKAYQEFLDQELEWNTESKDESDA